MVLQAEKSRQLTFGLVNSWFRHCFLCSLRSLISKKSDSGANPAINYDFALTFALTLRRAIGKKYDSDAKSTTIGRKRLLYLCMFLLVNC